MKFIKKITLTLGILYTLNGFAEAQVVDATPIDPEQIQNQAPVLSVEQRVSKLEAQLQNRQQLDLSGQIMSLQQAVQDLRGQVDLLTHQHQQLEQRLSEFYQDLNKRVEANKQAPRIVASTLPERPVVKPKPVVKPPRPAPKPVVEQPSDDNTDNFPMAAADNTALEVSDQQAISQPVPEAAATTTTIVQEQNAYQTAYNAIKSRNYAQAIPGMEKYLQQYPNGKYAANAHYWLGELYMVQGQSDKAASQFNTIISNYPSFEKIGDATLKLGIVYYNKGQYALAKQTFTQIKAKYAETTAARLADARLQEMARNGK